MELGGIGITASSSCIAPRQGDATTTRRSSWRAS
jgi:hypothetical protein